MKPEDVDPQVVEMLRHDPNAETYQFVVKAIPDGGDEALRQAMARLRLLEDDAPQRSRQLAAVQAERDASHAQATDAESALIGVQADRDAWHARAIDSENALMAAKAELHGITGSRSLRWTVPARRIAREARRVIGGR